RGRRARRAGRARGAHPLAMSRRLTSARKRQTNGPAAAAILAAGIGCFAFGALTTVEHTIAPGRDALALNPAVGSHSGTVTVAVPWRGGGGRHGAGPRRPPRLAARLPAGSRDVGGPELLGRGDHRRWPPDPPIALGAGAGGERGTACTGERWSRSSCYCSPVP